MGRDEQAQTAQGILKRATSTSHFSSCDFWGCGESAEERSIPNRLPGSTGRMHPNVGMSFVCNKAANQKFVFHFLSWNVVFCHKLSQSYQQIVSWKVNISHFWTFAQMPAFDEPAQSGS